MDRGSNLQDDAEEAANLLKFIDNQEIQEMDPSKAAGHHIPLEDDLKMMIKLKPNQRTDGFPVPEDSIRPMIDSLNSQELINMKVLVMGRRTTRAA